MSFLSASVMSHSSLGLGMNGTMHTHVKIICNLKLLLEKFVCLYVTDYWSKLTSNNVNFRIAQGEKC